jgi:hypothetical protein
VIEKVGNEKDGQSRRSFIAYEKAHTTFVMCFHFVRYLHSATLGERMKGTEVVCIGRKSWQSSNTTAETLGRRADGGASG